MYLIKTTSIGLTLLIHKLWDYTWCTLIIVPLFLDTVTNISVQMYITSCDGGRAFVNRFIRPLVRGSRVRGSRFRFGSRFVEGCGWSYVRSWGEWVGLGIVVVTGWSQRCRVFELGQ